MKRKKRRGQAQTAAYTETDRTYDKTAKAVLGNRQMLAPVVQRVVPEFHDISLEEIQDHCIDGEPQISAVPVAPGKTNRKRRRAAKYIRGLQTEDSVLPAERGERMKWTQLKTSYKSIQRDNNCNKLSIFRCDNPIIFLCPSPNGDTGEVSHVLNLRLG